MDWKEVLGKDFGAKLEDAMAEMAKGLGIAAKHLYIVLVKQQIADGIVTAVGCLIGLILLGILMWKGTKWLAKNEMLEFVIFIIFPLGGFIGCMFGFFYGVKHIINPEYYAIQDIMNFIHGGNN
jgi:hypothetical protein